MIDAGALARAVDSLAMFKFFPHGEHTRDEIAALLGRICHSEERLAWLIRRAVQVYNEWPGPAELRALYCECWTPADGVRVWSEKFPPVPGGGYPAHPVDDIPGYKGLPVPLLLIDAGRGEPVSPDESVIALIQTVAEKRSMPRKPRGYVRDATHQRLLDMGFTEK
jgi:hypothetical protein